MSRATSSVPSLALRLGGSLFATGDYRSGNEAIDIQEVVRLGRFATEMGNLAGNNVARTFAVWQLPERAEIINGETGTRLGIVFPAEFGYEWFLYGWPSVATPACAT